MLYESQSSSWEGILTVEHLRTPYEANEIGRAFEYHYYGSSNYVGISRTDGNRLVSQNASSRATNIGLEILYGERLGESDQLRASLGGRFAFFSSDDRLPDRQAGMEYYMSTWDTSTRIRSVLNETTGTPDGSGFRLAATAGRTVSWNSFMVTIGALAQFDLLKFGYDLQWRGWDSTRFVHSSGTTQHNLGPDARTVRYDHTVLNLRAAVPIGLEYEVVQNMHLRAGWMLQFTHRLEKQESLEQARRYVVDDIDPSSVTFGMGFRIFENLRADFVNVGDLSQPREWNVSAYYEF